MSFQKSIQQGLPHKLPASSGPSANAHHAPKRKDALSKDEKRLAVANALRYFPKNWHRELAPEFAKELAAYGRIYICIALCLHIRSMHVL